MLSSSASRLSSLNRAAMHITVSHRTTRGSFWRRWSTPCLPGETSVIPWKRTKNNQGGQKTTTDVQWSETDTERGERREEGGGRSRLKITALSFSASTLEFTVFQSLCNRNTALRQSPWVLTLSALPIWRQTTAGRDVNSLHLSVHMEKIKHQGSLTAHRRRDISQFPPT